MKLLRKVFTAFLLIICILSGAFSLSGQVKVDSLLRLLSAHPQQDSLRVNLQLQVARAYLTSDPGLAEYFASGAADLSQSLSYLPGLTEAQMIRAFLFMQRQQYEQALALYLNALAVAENNQDDFHAARIQEQLGDLYARLGIDSLALNAYQRAYSLQQRLRDTTSLIHLSGALGNIRIRQLAQKPPSLRDFSQVFELFNQEFTLASVKNDSLGMADALDNMGYIYFMQGQYDKATWNFSTAYDMFQRLHQPQRIARLSYETGALLLAQGKYDDAENQLQNAYQMASEQHDPFLLMNSCLKLALVKAIKNKPDEAIFYQNRFEQLRDSLNSLQQSKTIAELLSQYKSQKNENLIVSLREQQQVQQHIIRRQLYWVITIGCILLLIAIIAVLLWRENQLRKKHFEELQQKNQSIETTRNELEQKNKELEKLNKIKDRILSVISHDIRNPLASMEMMLELMKTGSLSMEEIANVTSSLSESLTETNNFLTNILEWSKSQMHGIQPKPALIKVKDIVVENVRFCQWQAEKKKIQIRYDVPERLQVYADREMLRIILRNITTNAIKFTHENGHIFIGAEKLNGMVKIWIKDDGVGIKPADRPKVFGMENFSSRGTANEIGTGLGLVLCKEMVESHGGSIWFESEENKGTTFYFTLPAQPKSAAEEG
ncbi:signal transduction histidine kinase [Thermoflavifilum aggregans]|uniref:histidine kinase n=1 Tax=Thermoflavifilum aggregans TaxID=454188 RepID=A0A2M9CUA1_9BACT|nr:tetratricopeptide repeat-containing sensor histidine kinase [Thermoflavifilum aggregans]MBX6379529.1 tetratricopeptide repeat-containing sensor histidine kinase [Thermoflavifilum aggregans]PJJ75425.1 signal transduction histidine kinase [Thermoflavifilum aggregans]